jgi:hypothetical protein
MNNVRILPMILAVFCAGISLCDCSVAGRADDTGICDFARRLKSDCLVAKKSLWHDYDRYEGIDNSSFRQVDQFARWSANLHLPWAYVLDAELNSGVHELTLRTTDRRNPNSRGYACRIVHFLAN